MLGDVHTVEKVNCVGNSVVPLQMDPFFFGVIFIITAQIQKDTIIKTPILISLWFTGKDFRSSVIRKEDNSFPSLVHNRYLSLNHSDLIMLKMKHSLPKNYRHLSHTSQNFQTILLVLTKSL